MQWNVASAAPPDDPADRAAEDIAEAPLQDLIEPALLYFIARRGSAHFARTWCCTWPKTSPVMTAPSAGWLSPCLGAHGNRAHREGDYLGATVNVAARVASQAVRGQFLVTDGVRRELAEGVAVEHAGWRSLKGVADEVELFEVVTSRARRPVDPVCGMIIDPDSCLVTLERNETRVYFCSEACRSRFRADPHRYRQPSTA